MTPFKTTEYKLLDRAIAIAVCAHSGVADKGGKPYILHPLHLMQQLMFDPELAAIAVMHDVIEDSQYTLEELKEDEFSPRVQKALRLLTHEKGVLYEVYIERMCDNFDAIRVKRKDLEHNSAITRLKGLTEKDLKRVEKYHKAFVVLGIAKKKFLNKTQ